MKLSVVILAAGQGKRMRSRLPKVLHALAGRPLLQHVVDTAYLLKPAQVLIVHGQAGVQLQAAIQGDTLQWVEQPQALGTGHAVQQAMLHLAKRPDEASHVLVLYGDVPAISVTTLEQMCGQARAGAAGVVLTAKVSNATGLGRILRDSDGHLCGIVEELDASPSQKQLNEINSGLMLFRYDLLQQLLPQLQANNAQGEYYLTDVIHLAQKQGSQLATVLCAEADEIQGVNDRGQLAQLERYYQQRQAQQLMLQGVTLADPKRFDCRGHLIAGMDVFIDINCVFEGRVELGEGVTIGPNCLIKDSTLASGVTVHANTLIDGSQINADAIVGPYARLRPQTQVGEKAHVGNFVELKKTQLGAHSKANHLAYLGDTIVGERVNIGAGVITCNYDGANKHVTTIEDDVFVGSDCQLIAPIRLAKGATIGAGTTLTRDAPADALTLSRAEQVSRSGWRRPSKTKKQVD